MWTVWIKCPLQVQLICIGWWDPNLENLNASLQILILSLKIYNHRVEELNLGLSKFLLLQQLVMYGICKEIFLLLCNKEVKN